MKARGIATLVALGFATAARGQAPATAGKPAISKPCLNCHKAAFVTADIEIDKAGKLTIAAN